jgi:tRNA pseudouridine32 synthase/23S rRNA pseudouridine746 synthase
MRPCMAAIPTDPPILFRDQRFVVLDKPAGLPVHPGPRGGPSVEDWFPSLSRRKDGPWLAHRLDADTAGCLVIALRKAALIAAQAAFAEGRARKSYWAVVSGGPVEDAGTVDAPLARRDGKAGWRMAPDPSGHRAVTDWRVLGRVDGLAWLELHPHTGRTHQIRVHCALLGCPILGDPVYGESRVDGKNKDKSLPFPLREGVGARGRNRTNSADATPLPEPPPQGGRATFIISPLHLLARSISLPLDPPLTATAEPPTHMWDALAGCGWIRPRRSDRGS